MSSSSLVIPGVVVGLDNGGTATNATVLDGFGRFLVDDLCETPSRVLEGPPATLDALRRGVRRGARADRAAARRGRRGRPRHPRTGQRRRRDLVEGLDELLPAGVARLRHPRRARDQARPAGRLQQRRQRGRAVRPPPALRGGGGAAVLGLRDRRHRPRRRRGGARPGREGRGRHGRRARARAHPDARAARRGPAAAGLQLRLRRRRGERGLADRDREEPAALLAEPLPGPSARAGAADRAAAAKLVRGLRRGRGRTGAGDLRAAGDGARPAVHDRGELHRPGRVLPRRRRGRGRAALPVWFLDRVRDTPAPARRAGEGGDARAGAGPGHGRCARRRDRRPRHRGGSGRPDARRRP